MLDPGLCWIQQMDRTLFSLPAGSISAFIFKEEIEFYVRMVEIL